MATNDNSSLYKRLAELQANRPQNAVVPSQKAALNFRDAKIKALQTAPGLTERLQQISKGGQPAPSGALGTIGNLLVNNPISKTVLGGLSAIDIPRRLVISGIKEFKDAVDNNPNTQASFKDYKDQVADPNFGFGRVVPMSGWGGRIIGLIGDIALDPLTYATLGGTISKKAVTQTGKGAIEKFATEAAKRSDELANLGLGGVSDTVVNALRKTSKYEEAIPTREFLGTKSIQGRRGSEALASGARKLGATDAEIAEILKRGRNGLTPEMAKLMGMNDYGIYYLGSRIRVPFSGYIGRGLASGITNARLGILNTRAGEYLGKLITPTGTAANLDLRDIRFAGRAGKSMPGNLTPKMGLAILDADNAARAARGVAARDGANIVAQALSDPDVVAESSVIYKYLDTDVIPTNISDRQRRAMQKIKDATDKLYENIDSYGRFVAGNEPNGFVIAGRRKNFFPHKMTASAQDFVQNSSSQRAIDVRRYMKVDHTNIGGSFESRNLEALVNSGETVDWFGKILTPEDIAGGVDRLNELARLGGFKGDFFETDIRKALTSYLSNYAEGIGTIAFYQNLKESGNDIASMAVQRGMITKEALESILTQPERTAKAVKTAYELARKEMSDFVNTISKEAQSQLKEQTRLANLSQEEVGKLLLGGTDAEQLIAQKTLSATEADAALRTKTAENVQKAIEKLNNARALIVEKHAKHMAMFQEQSVLLAEQQAHHQIILESLDLRQTALNQYLDVLTQASEAPPAEYVNNLLKNLQTMQDVVAQSAAEIEHKFNIFTRDSLEFLNDALSDLSNYTTVGNKNASQVITDLKNLAKFGQIQIGQNVKSRGGQKGLNFDTVIRPYLNATEKAVPIGNQEQWNAWVKLKNQLELDTITRSNLEKKTIADVRETLARAATSTDPTDLGDVRAAISWLFVRAQVDDPNFAKNLLDNPTEEYKAILRITKNDAIRKKYGIIKVVEDKLDGYIFTNIKELPAGLKLPAQWLVMDKQIRELERRLLAVPEHLAKVPDTGLGVTNRVYSSFVDVFGDYNQSQILKPEGYDAVINHLKQLNADNGIVGLEDYVKQLETAKNNPGAQISLGELSDDIQERFAAAESRIKITDNRLSNNELSFYESKTQPNLPLRNRIIEKQKAMIKERDELIQKQNKLTSRLPKDTLDEINFLVNSGGQNPAFGYQNPIDISQGSMELAKAAMNFYIKEESKYVLRMANELLGASGRTLTPQGHARMTHEIYETFARTATEHVDSLERAKNLLEPIAEEVVASGRNAEEMQLLLLEKLRAIMNNPDEREVLQEIFPNLVLNLELKKLSDIKTYLASDLQYQNIVNSIADIEVRAFPVSQMSNLGGAGVIDFRTIADPVMAAKMETSRRAQESVLGSEGLQKSKILQSLANKGHEGYKTYLTNLKKRILGTKTFGDELKKQLSYDIDVQMSLLDEHYSKVAKELEEAKQLAKETATAQRKEIKKLSARMSGPQRIKELQKQTRAFGKRRDDAGYFAYQADSIDRYINDALNSNINSTRAIKELFGALFGGERYATPTLRGSEAARLSGSGTLSLRVQKQEDSFFYRNLKNAKSMRDELRVRTYSSNPEEAQILRQRKEYVDYLQQTLDDLEQMIKAKPEAAKALKQATKELDAAEKQIAQVNGVPLSYEERMAYIDHVRFAFGEIKARERVFNLNTRQWEFKRIKNADRPELKPIPEGAFTPDEANLVKKYIDAKTKHQQFIETEEYGMAAREESLMKFKRELAAADLSKITWTVTGDTSNAESWTPQLNKIISNSIASDPTNLPFDAQQVILQNPLKGGVAKLPDPFNKDLPKLINRMSDPTQPELIFLDANNNQIQLRVARDAEGKSLGYLEKLQIKTRQEAPVAETAPGGVTKERRYVPQPRIDPNTGQPVPNEFDWVMEYTKAEIPAAGPAAQTIRQKTIYERVWEPWNFNMERLSVIEPASVIVEDGQKASRKTITTAEKFNPDDAWVPIVKTNDPDLILDSPTQYVRMSAFTGTMGSEKSFIQLPDSMGGGNFMFTPPEQEALFTDFLSDYYRRNATYFSRPSAFVAEVKRREQQIAGVAQQIKKSYDDLGRKQNLALGKVYTSKYDKKVAESLKADLELLQNDLNEFLRSKEVWDSRASTNKKVAFLYNFFDSTESRTSKIRITPDFVDEITETGMGSPSNVLSGVTGNKPYTRLQKYIEEQNVVDDLDNSVKVSKETASERRKIINGSWVGTPEEALITKASNMVSDVNGIMMTYGQSTEQLLARLLSTRARYDSVIKMDGLKAEMQKAVLAKQLQQSGVISPEATDITVSTLRKGVAQETATAEQALNAGPFVQDLPGRQPMADELAGQQAAYNPPQVVRKEIDAAAQKKSDSFGMETAPPGVGFAGEVAQIESLQFAKELEQEVAWIQAIQLKEQNVKTAMAGAVREEVKEIDKETKLLAQSEKELAKINKKQTDALRGISKLGNVTKEETALENARRAYDAAQIATTPEDVNIAMQKIIEIDNVLKSSARVRAAIKGIKGKEGYDAFVTEFQMFVDEATKFAQIAINPSVDKNIRDQASKWILANTEYYKQVAILNSQEHIARIANGLTKSSYLKETVGKDGKVRQELVEGVQVPKDSRLNYFVDTDFVTSFDEGMVQLSKQFPTTQVAPQIAEFVKNVHRLQEPAIARELNMFLGKYTRFFKAYATLSPGFHVRNSISNGFMLFAAGGSPRYLMEGLQMSRSLNEASRAGKSVEQWLQSLPVAKRAKAEIAVRASFASGGGNAADNLRQLYMSGRLINNPLTRGSKGLGQWIEGHSRFMLAYDGAMQGMDFNTSAARVQRFLIDYEDLSTLDKSLRQIIPFWMWTSRNLPMQIQNIWLNPRAYQIYGNTKRNFRDDKEGEIVPAWMQEMGAWKLPFGRNIYATPDIGFNRIQADVNMLQDPARFLSNVNPLVRLPIELTGERQLFSNKRFSQTPVEVTGGVGAALQPLMELLGYGETGAGGRKFVDDKAYYALRNLIPLLSRAESLSPSIPTDPGTSMVNPLLGLVGAPIKEVNQQMQDNELLRRLYDMQEIAKRDKAINNPEG